MSSSLYIHPYLIIPASKKPIGTFNILTRCLLSQIYYFTGIFSVFHITTSNSVPNYPSLQNKRCLFSAFRNTFLLFLLIFIHNFLKDPLASSCCLAPKLMSNDLRFHYGSIPHPSTQFCPNYLWLQSKSPKT